MVLRACIKGVLLYLLFILAYNAVQPVLMRRLPTLYNTILPGRVRFNTDIETNIGLMLNDHIIQQASDETWNIVMLGSSETYGLYDAPDNAMPMYLDRWGLESANGRPVRVYNLSYPIPDVAKDLMIAESVVQSRLPIDLLVLNVNGWSFSPLGPHDMLYTNPEVRRDLLSRYGFASTYFTALPPVPERSFWTDRPTLAAWMQMQVEAVRWTVTRRDERGNGPQKTLTLDTGVSGMMLMTRVEGLKAFRQLRDNYGVPILVVSVPRTYSQDDFLPWLYIESGNNGLPLLDCEFIFGDTSFFIDSVHLQPATDPLYARILAQHWSRDEMASVAPGLPLRLPDDFTFGDFVERAEEECVFLPGA